MKSKYIELKDGDGFRIIKPGGMFYFACCDCGLIHKFEFSDNDEAIFLKMFRDNRRTSVYRKAHRIVVTLP